MIETKVNVTIIIWIFFRYCADFHQSLIFWGLQILLLQVMKDGESQDLVLALKITYYICSSFLCFCIISTSNLRLMRRIMELRIGLVLISRICEYTPPLASKGARSKTLMPKSVGDQDPYIRWHVFAYKPVHIISKIYIISRLPIKPNTMLFFFCFFRTALVAYGISWAESRIGAAAADVPQLSWIWDPYHRLRQCCILNPGKGQGVTLHPHRD